MIEECLEDYDNRYVINCAELGLDEDKLSKINDDNLVKLINNKVFLTEVKNGFNLKSIINDERNRGRIIKVRHYEYMAIIGCGCSVKKVVYNNYKIEKYVNGQSYND